MGVHFDYRHYAAAAFLDRLFGAVLRQTGKHYWAEKTPHTVKWAHVLYRMYPNMRYIHIIRDPRDVYASVLEQKWGAGTLSGFINFYKQVMGTALTSRESVPAHRYQVISLYDLVYAPDAVNRVMDFIGVPYEAEWIEEAKQIINADKARFWRYEALPEEEVRKIEDWCLPHYNVWLELSRATAWKGGLNT
jgi:hypothetical protein